MSPSRRPRFVWDTSALIAAWVERYPPDVIPEMWEKVEEAIRSGVMVAPEEVGRELKERSAELREFLQQFPGFFVPTGPEVLSGVSIILEKHRRLVMARKLSSAADPFVIATARILGAMVVTEEGRGSPAKPKIPDVCDAYQIECVSVLDFIRKVGWRFGR